MSTDADIGKILTSAGAQLSDRDEQARRSVKAFRALQPTLTAYAKLLSRRSDVRVEMSSRDNGSTDGSRIFYRPPIALGDMTPHQRKLCDKRDEELQQRCPACNVREDVLATIYHEIAHICYDSFAPPTDTEKARLLEEAVKQVSSAYAEAVKNRIQTAPSYTKNSYVAMASLVNPFLPLILNSLEDARVNRELFKARKGTKKMFDAQVTKVFRDGVEQRNAAGEIVVIPWTDYPQNMQAIIGLFCKVSGYTYDNWFIPPVVEALNDEELTSIISRMDTVRSASGVYHLSFAALQRLRELGFCRQDSDPVDKPEEQPEDESSDESPSAQDSSSSDDDQSDAEDSENSGGEAQGDDQADQESGSSGDDSDSGQDSSSDDSESVSSDDSNSDSEDGNGRSDGGPDDMDMDSDDSSSSDGDSSDGSGENTDMAGPEGVGSADDTDGSDSELEADAEADGGDDSGSESLSESSATNETFGESGDGRGADGESSDEQTGSGDTGRTESALQEENGEESSPSGLEGSGDIEGEQLSGDSSGEANTKSDRSPGDDSVRDGSDSEGDSSDDDSGESPLGETESDSIDSKEDESSDNLAGDREPESYGDSHAPDDSSEQLDEDVIDTGADEGLGGTKVLENDSPVEYPEMGTAEEVEDKIQIWGMHDDPPKSIEQRREEELDDMAVEKAIIQGMYFETPSGRVYGVKEYHYGDAERGDAWDMATSLGALGYGRRALGVEGDFDPPESILGPALLQMRRTFTDNARGRETRNLRRGRVNPKVLGRRAPFEDERLFERRQQPGKKKYFVLIGMDISGSTVGLNIALEKRAVTAQAELCARIGVDFAIYAHTGSYNGQMWMDMYHIKDLEDPWDSNTRERLHEIGPSNVNLDGHTLEYYRKCLDKSDATDKIIMYYTDGKMPAENYDEELEILQRELKVCQQRRYTVMGVGIRTDSPIRHGLDTVQVDGDEDIGKVVQHLEKRLLSSGPIVRR